ncbi:nucleotidyltransferase [uncultured Sphingomonas sp.]|uniref:nucleotidyltransferase domain-containing protein n=1 Tax=uncultured Sphingomonas sp. TaxID=158754 RepID=UPI0025DCCA6C|nr:nucleotidyltransferase [uncultured Sphingomonas sp.]
MLHSTPVDRYYDDLLADVARRIQLTPTAYKEAVGHFDAVSRYLDEHESGFPAYSPVIYPQGSFRMGSTISAYDDREDYDIDLLLELALDPQSDPEAVLRLVARSLEQGKGRLKFTTCEIKKRCVTLGYANMHLDVTPAVLVPFRDPRVITIFDRHPQRPDHALANPEGFARWFDGRVRPRSVIATRATRAQVVPVPEQTPAEHKLDRLLAIQLLKRFRDIRCDRGGYDRCPSVLLSCLAAQAPQGTGLVTDLRSTALHVAREVSVANLRVENPACRDDVLSDRWPRKSGSNHRFAADLVFLAERLDELARADGTQVRKLDILKDLFGENAARGGFQQALDRAAAQSRSGQFAAGKTGAVSFAGAVPAGSVAAPTHRFYGEPAR